MQASRLVRVNPASPDPAAIEAAARVLRSGGLVVLPTETFYGLAADASSEAGCQRVFEAKGRPAHKGLPCLAEGEGQVSRFTTSFPPLARRLAERFWPGPLSLVLNAVPGLFAAAPDGTVAVRVSGLAVARSLPEALGRLVTATSANRAGAPPPTTVRDVLGSLDPAAIDLILDGGPCSGGKPSTLVDVRSGRPSLVREGTIAWSEVREAVSKSDVP